MLSLCLKTNFQYISIWTSDPKNFLVIHYRTLISPPVAWMSLTLNSIPISFLYENYTVCECYLLYYHSWILGFPLVYPRKVKRFYLEIRMSTFSFVPSKFSNVWRQHSSKKKWIRISGDSAIVVGWRKKKTKKDGPLMEIKLGKETGKGSHWRPGTKHRHVSLRYFIQADLRENRN